MTVHDSIDFTHTASTSPTKNSLLVFMITGNPGLIEYYRTFLTLCFDSLRTNYPDHHIKVAGTSLRGFGVQDDNHQHSVNNSAKGPYDLEQQIEHIGQMLERAIETHARYGSSPKVVLMGHSVGSYILLEVLRRRKQSPTTQQSSNNAKVIGGICLFPTVTHIAKSPSGKKFSVCRLCFCYTRQSDNSEFSTSPCCWTH
jgi:pimeloyl-ACP methyl ester carboxylesterase